MSDEQVIKELSGYPDRISDILHKAGFLNIKQNGDKIFFAFDGEGGSGSCVVNIHNLLFNRFSKSIGGRIFDAIMAKKSMGFNQSVNWIHNNINKSPELSKKDINTSFSEMFRPNNPLEYKKYTPEEIEYTPAICQMFLDDNISMAAQVFFEIKYDKFSERNVITWKDIDGNIVGFNKRANFEISKDYRFKYITSEGFLKGNHLYGLYENKSFIEKSKAVVVVESEKSVLQAYSFGYRNIVAMGSSKFTDRQCEILYNMGVNTIVLMYDEGSEYDKVESVLDKLYRFKKVIAFYYINDYSKFETGSKDSPTDNGKEKFLEIINTSVKRYENWE